MIIVNLSLIYRIENKPDLPKVSTLFIGDSHTRYSINPDSFTNAVNYGLNGDLLISQLWKLPYVSRPIVDTIYISIGYHNFAENHKNIFHSDHGMVPKLIGRYIFIAWREIWDLSNSPRAIISELYKKIQLPKQKPRYLGTYVANKDVMPLSDSANAAIHRHFPNREALTFNKENQKIIQEIIEYCESEKITLLFHKPPVHRLYKPRIPEDNKKRTDDFLNYLRKKEMLIEIQQTPFQDKHFFDGDHLNSEGSKLYTHLLKRAIQKNK